MEEDVLHGGGKGDERDDPHLPFAGGAQEAKHLATVLGGDTDTIGAMAGALVGGRYGASAPPSRWIKALETGPQGKDGLIECADRLYHRAVTAPGPTGGTDPGPAGMGP